MTYADAAQYLAVQYGFRLVDCDRLMQAARQRGVGAETVVQRIDEHINQRAIGRRAAFSQVTQELATGLLHD